MTHYYRPCAFVLASVPILGKAEDRVQLRIRPKRVTIVANDFTEADRCTLVADWSEAGVDPRWLSDAVVTVYIGDADDFGSWSPSRANARFIGVVKEVEAHREMDQSAEVTFDCLDYTDFFLRAKPFGSSGIPSLSQTLEDAWNTIVSQTPGAGALAGRLRAVGGADLALKVGEGAAERFQKLAKVATVPDTDAWAVWQQCVGMLGLISFIRLDECIVTTATDYYTKDDSPQFVWGRNLASWSESRIAECTDAGIGITSYDPLTRRTHETLYPPVGDPPVRGKRSKAARIGDANDSHEREKRTYFAIPGVTDADILAKIAKSIYEQRSNQEIAGRISTPHMSTTRDSGAPFDLLTLAAGDTIDVQVEAGLVKLLSHLPDGARRDYLMDQGYASDVAELIIRNMDLLAKQDFKVHVRSSTAELELTSDGGSFSIEISYVNRIDVEA